MHVQTEAEHTYAADRTTAFDHLTAASTLSKICTKWGPIAAIVDASMVDGAEVAEGAHRTVRMSDGVVLDEEIVAFARPVEHAYAWRGGLKPPFAWLVRGAKGHWTFADSGSGTRVTWTYRFELTSPLAYPVAAVAMRLFRAWMRQALANADGELGRP